MAEPAPNHEFDAKDNATIGALGNAMAFVAAFQAVAGMLFGAALVLSLLGGDLINAIWYLFLTIANVLLAATLFQAAAKFRKIVFTAGGDVGLLMTALEQLLRYFWVRRVLLLSMLVVLALGVAASFALASEAS